MQVRSCGACLTLAAAQKLKIAAPCYLGLGKKSTVRFNAFLGSWFVSLHLECPEAQEVQHLYQDLARTKAQSVLPQMTRNEIILTQLEAVQALQCPWQCDGALAMSLMDKLALMSAIKNRSGPGFTFFSCILFV